MPDKDTEIKFKIITDDTGFQIGKRLLVLECDSNDETKPVRFTQTAFPGGTTNRQIMRHLGLLLDRLQVRG